VTGQNFNGRRSRFQRPSLAGYSGVALLNLCSKIPALFMVIALALSAACNKEVTSGKPDQSESRYGANANSPQQAPITGTSEAQTESFRPTYGYVPDEQTAISIAVAVWAPMYGKDQIESEKPFRAMLKNGVWTVMGTLPEGYDGGTAFAQIAQKDGRLIRVNHYK
jgi:hypothetical protein